MRLLLSALALLAGASLAYLGLRVADERRTVAAKVAAIIERADPDERTLARQRVAQLLAVEDPTFWTNDGLDFRSPGAGMTTISQSLGKRIFFDGFQPGLAKVELIALTRFALAPKVAKRDVLTAFVASARFNRGVVGFADAANAIFAKPLPHLSDREWLTLVAMLPAPRDYDPRVHPAASRERVNRIEKLLARNCRPSGFRDVKLEGCA